MASWKGWSILDLEVPLQVSESVRHKVQKGALWYLRRLTM